MSVTRTATRSPACRIAWATDNGSVTPGVSDTDAAGNAQTVLDDEQGGEGDGVGRRRVWAARRRQPARRQLSRST